MNTTNVDTVAQSERISLVRKAAPIILALVLFALGAYALYHLLKPVKAADVIAQVRTTPWTALLAAFAATATGYVALIGYDWSALRSLGKKGSGESDRYRRISWLQLWQHNRR